MFQGAQKRIRYLSLSFKHYQILYEWATYELNKKYVFLLFGLAFYFFRVRSCYGYAQHLGNSYFHAQQIDYNNFLVRNFVLSRKHSNIVYTVNSKQ
jgi:hypothetical protein